MVKYSDFLLFLGYTYIHISLETYDISSIHKVYRNRPFRILNIVQAAFFIIIMINAYASKRVPNL
jgi:hypothetical protein